MAETKKSAPATKEDLRSLGEQLTNNLRAVEEWVTTDIRSVEDSLTKRFEVMTNESEARILRHFDLKIESIRRD